MAELKTKPEIRFTGFTGTWEQRKLSELVTPIIREVPKPTEPYDKISVRSHAKGTFHQRIENPDSVTMDKLFVVKENDLIVNITFAWEHAIAVATKYDDGLLVSHRFPTYIATNSDIGLIEYVVSQEDFRRKMELISPGGAGRNRVLDKKEFLNIEVIAPNDIGEQNKIGVVFRELDHLITLHQREYDKTVNIKKAMLEKMFPKDGTDRPEIRFVGFNDAWEQRTVSDLTDRYDNLRVPITASLRVPGNTPYYGANGIQDYIEGFTHDGEFILVAEDGANDVKNYPVQYVKGRVWINNHAHVLQAKTKITDNRFLMYAIQQANIEPYLVGGGRAKLNADVMMKINFHVPGLAEQLKIGLLFANINDLITLHQRELAKLQNMKKALLEKMFV